MTDYQIFSHFLRVRNILIYVLFLGRIIKEIEMNCSTPVTHTIQAGDTLYSLARRYDTTVTNLLDLNPGIEVYNLRIGTTILVCRPNITPVPPIGVVPAPITPELPPVEMMPPAEMFRELLQLILRWVREQFGEAGAREILSVICEEFRRR